MEENSEKLVVTNNNTEEKHKPFDGVGKPLALITKCIAVSFIICFSIFYCIIKQNPLTVNSALGLLLITVGIDLIFLSVNTSILISNIGKLRKAVLGSADVLDKMK